MKEYTFTIKKTKYGSKPFLEYKDNRINRGLTLKEIRDLYVATKKIVEEEK
tara:strand:- start:1195 stop:1347 length:153 start_codon:yes stop_codon:yes gene_type:complete